MSVKQYHIARICYSAAAIFNLAKVMPHHYTIRRANIPDLDQVVSLDARVTGTPKPEYWRQRFESSRQPGSQQYFLVAEQDGRLLGFTLGEIRAWEFGSQPCGWIFAIGVDPEARLERVGSDLFDAMCRCFRETGVTKIRTMIARDAQLVMSFFRSQGLMAGPFVQLEMDLES